MKKNILVLVGAFAGLLVSCSSEDVKSSENYIESFRVAGVEGEIRNDQKLVYIWTEASNYQTLIKGVPEIEVSLGASYSTSADDWTAEGFKYIVKAENGDINSYSVQIDTTVPKKYNFEVWTQPSGYYIPSGSSSNWTSGNEGISWALSILGRGKDNPENYPTKKTTEGYSGNAVLMETIGGGTVVGRKKPLFSGNLILGNFNMKVAMSNELAAIEIGRIYPAKPKKITGYYKYQEGDSVFISGEDAEQVPGRPDSCSMIVKFYRSDLPGGKDTILTVENIDYSELVIAKTRKQDCSATTGDGFHPFELTLDYDSEPDFQNHRYKLGITFAASKDGDSFSGKIGSKLIVDEIEIIDYD